jgi:hypothetical protein
MTCGHCISNNSDLQRPLLITFGFAFLHQVLAHNDIALLVRFSVIGKYATPAQASAICSEIPNTIASRLERRWECYATSSRLDPAPGRQSVQIIENRGANQTAQSCACTPASATLISALSISLRDRELEPVSY